MSSCKSSAFPSLCHSKYSLNNQVKSSKQIPDVALCGTPFSATSCSEGKTLPGTAQVAHTKCKLKPQLPPRRGGSPSSTGLVTCAPDLSTGEREEMGGKDRNRAQSRDEPLGVLKWLWSTKALTWRRVSFLSTEPA